MITRGSEEDLILDPGRYSVDPDEDSFDATVSEKADARVIHRSLLLIFSRNGDMTIIVECMECRTFLIYKERCCPSMILDLILVILRVSPIAQV